MKGYKLVLALFFTLSLTDAFSQADSINIKEVKYKPVTEDYFADYKDAKLIVNYYCSDGWSATNRYTYQVVLIDTMLMLGFYSPETDGLRYISYEKKISISSQMEDSVKNILGAAGLKQIKQGIPEPQRSDYTKQVLIVRYANLDIAGGMFFYNMMQNNPSPDKIKSTVQKQRSLTSSIGGDYDSLIKSMSALFPDLDGLLSQALKIKR